MPILDNAPVSCSALIRCLGVPSKTPGLTGPDPCLTATMALRETWPLGLQRVWARPLIALISIHKGQSPSGGCGLNMADKQWTVKKVYSLRQLSRNGLGINFLPSFLPDWFLSRLLPTRRPKSLRFPQLAPSLTGDKPAQALPTRSLVKSSSVPQIPPRPHVWTIEGGRRRGRFQPLARRACLRQGLRG